MSPRTAVSNVWGLPAAIVSFWARAVSALLASDIQSPRVRFFRWSGLLRSAGSRSHTPSDHGESLPA